MATGETADVAWTLETADVAWTLETTDAVWGELVEALLDEAGAKLEDEAGGILLQEYDG